MPAHPAVNDRVPPALLADRPQARGNERIEVLELVPQLPPTPAIITTILLAIEYAVKIAAIGIVPENRRPGSSTGWLMLILFVPIIGIPAFLIFGSPYVNNRRRRIQAEANELLKKGTDDMPDFPDTVRPDVDIASLIRMNRNLTFLPMVDGTNHGVMMDYEESIVRMAHAVDQAERYVHAEIYICAWDPTTDIFFEALENAAGRGVDVKLMFDHMGSRKYKGFHSLGRRLSSGNIRWQLMLPFRPLHGSARRIDLRNHRKLLIIDGQRAIMGSQNMVEAGYLSKKNHKLGRRWNDITVDLSGEIVTEISSVFATDWYSESGEELDIEDYRMP